MGAQGESRLSGRIQKSLQRAWPHSWWVKAGGNSQRGTPDILGCVQGLFVGLEVKMPGREDTVTTLQSEVHRHISKAGGYVAVVTSSTEAVDLITHELRRREITGPRPVPPAAPRT